MESPNYKCSIHPGKKVIVICTFQGCETNFLCGSCLNSHPKSHSDRLIFLGETIFDEDSFIYRIQNEINEKNHDLNEIIKRGDEFISQALIQIEHYFNQIQNNITQKIREKKINVSAQLKAKLNNLSNSQFDKCKTYIDNLSKIVLKPEDIKDFMFNLNFYEMKLLPEIDALLGESNQSLVNLSFSIKEDEIVKLKQNFNNLIAEFDLNKIAQIKGFFHENAFNYSGNNFENGLFYWLGTDRGSEPWQNPSNGNYVNISASSISEKTPIDNILSNKIAKFETEDQPNSWVLIELLEHLRFCPTNLTLAKGSEEIFPIRFKLEGSDDGEKWEILESFNFENKDLWEKNEIFTLKIDSKKFFGSFKITQTGENNKNSNVLSFSGLEFYGNLELVS